MLFDTVPPAPSCIIANRIKSRSIWTQVLSLVVEVERQSRSFAPKAHFIPKVLNFASKVLYQPVSKINTGFFTQFLFSPLI
jgi:hypothetical protein